MTDDETKPISRDQATLGTPVRPTNDICEEMLLVDHDLSSNQCQTQMVKPTT